jgi:hypothetical protein
MLTISQDGLTPNRSINDAHVTRLKKAMSKNIKRTEPQYRMRVSMRLADYERAVTHSVNRHALWSRELHGANVEALTVEELDKKIRGDWNSRTGTLQDFAPLPWPSTASQDPQLDSGRHRRAAFLDINAKQLREHIDITPSNIHVRLPSLSSFFPFPSLISCPTAHPRPLMITFLQETAWVCDIHDFDKCDVEYFQVARIKEKDVYLSQSEGDSFVTAWDAWTSLTATDRMKIRKNESTMAAWLEGELGFKVDSISRYNQLLKNDGWNTLAKQFCNHRFGRETFVISNFTDCMQHRIREVRSDSIHHCR